MHGRPPTSVTELWQEVARDEFRDALAAQFFVDTEVVTSKTMPPGLLDELRRKIQKRTDKVYHGVDGQGPWWDVDSLVEEVGLADVFYAFRPPTDWDDRVEFFEAMEPERIVTTGRDGRLFLFDEAKRCVYLSSTGRIDYRFNYRKAADAANAVSTRSFAMWPLRNL